MKPKRSRFDVSREKGAHALLARMAGAWTGEIRTWFEPGKLADTSSVEGEVRVVLDGRIAVHEYRASIQGQPFSGIALHGFDLHRGGFETAWADSVHNGTRIMLSQGTGSARRGRWSVNGTYPAGPDSPDWGWRTEVDVSKAPERLTIRHYNVTPAGQEALGVEFAYVRRASKPRRPRAKTSSSKRTRRRAAR